MEIDWSKCDLVEVDRSRVGGRPVLKDTRMPVDDLVANFEYGVPVEEISMQFRIDVETLKKLLSYAERRHTIARSAR